LVVWNVRVRVKGSGFRVCEGSGFRVCKGSEFRVAKPRKCVFGGLVSFGTAEKVDILAPEPSKVNPFVPEPSRVDLFVPQPERLTCLYHTIVAFYQL